MKIKQMGILVLGAMALAACGNGGSTKESTTTQDSKAPATSETTASETATDSLAGKEITVYSAGPDDLAANIQKAFQDKTGVKVNLFQGTTGKILAKLAAEKGNPVADVLVLASLSTMDGLKQAGELQAYPGAVGQENLNPEWQDKDSDYFAYSASALGITYNTDHVTEPPQEWTDLADSKWKDKFNMPDPSLSGSALDFTFGYTVANDWNTVESWFNNGLQIMGANKEALDAVITGEKDVTLSGVDYMTYDAKAKGEPVDIVYPASGTVVSPRAAAITSTSKEVAASQAFIDFLLSDEGQKLVADAYLLPGNSNTPVKDRAKLSDINQIKVDWTNSEDKQVEVLDHFASLAE